MKDKNSYYKPVTDNPTKCAQCPGRVFNGPEGLAVHKRMLHRLGRPRSKRKVEGLESLRVGSPAPRAERPTAPTLNYCPRCGLHLQVVAKAAELLSRVGKVGV